MISQPTGPVHPTSDVQGLPAVPASNQQTRRRGPSVAGRKRRRRDHAEDHRQEHQADEPAAEAGEKDEHAGGHVDCLA